MKKQRITLIVVLLLFLAGCSRTEGNTDVFIDSVQQETADGVDRLSDHVQQDVVGGADYLTDNRQQDAANGLDYFVGNWSYEFDDLYIIYHIFNENNRPKIYESIESLDVFNLPLSLECSFEDNQLIIPINDEENRATFVLTASAPDLLEGTKTQYGETDEVILERVTETPELFGSDLDPIFITRQQLEEDFEEFFDILDKDYPHYSTAQYIYGTNRDEIIERYRKKLDHFPERIDLLEAMQYFMEITVEFGMTGHICVMEYPSYSYLVRKGQINFTAFDNRETVQNTYGYLKYNNNRLLHEEIFDAFPERLQVVEETPTIVADAIKLTSNISYKIMDEDTVYLCIYSFMPTDTQKEQEELDKLFEQIAGYKNLIIDITNNGGGSDNYWMEYIVAPNIDQRMDGNIYGLFKSTGIYADYANNDLFNRDSAVYKAISEMPKIKDETLEEFDLALRDNYSVKPRVMDSKVFGGDIYVLTDMTIYSASEGFVMFCKDTGFATLVGTNTSGDGGILNIREFSLTNTGLLIRFSTMFSLNSDGTSNTKIGTTPDYIAPVGVSALDACLDIIYEED